MEKNNSFNELELNENSKHQLFNANGAKIVTGENIRLYNFKEPDKFSRQILAVLKVIFENFGRDAGITLSTITQSNCYLEVSKVDQRTFGEIIRAMDSITTLSLISVEPQEGQAIIDFNLDFVQNIIQKVFGGTESGHSQRTKDLTTIERRVVARVVNRMLEVLLSCLQNLDITDIRLDKIETNPNFISQVASTMEVCVKISFNFTIDNYTIENGMSVILPYLMLESLLPKLTNSSILMNNANNNEYREQTRRLLEANLKETDVHVQAELGRSKMTLKEVSELKVNDVIVLDTRIDENLKFFAENKLLSSVKAGVHRGKVSVIIDDIHE